MLRQEEIKPTTDFQSLAEELQSHILSFLPYRDILRCTSLCKALRQTYISSSELQYIVELGGQQLLPVPNADLDHSASNSQRLQLLRDNAHAWFKFDIHSFETVSIPVQNKMWVANGHLCLWERHHNSTTVFPILPKPSQYKIECDRAPTSLRSDPNAYSFDVIMDPAQNLIAIAYASIDDDFHWDEEEIYVVLGVLDGGGIHPQAAGQTLFRSKLPGIQSGDNTSTDLGSLKLKCFGRHIALCYSLRITSSDFFNEWLWGLQIWDWQHSTTSSSVLSDTIHPPREAANDFCFLGNDRLLIFGDDMKLYSIEDMSQAPQLLACFLLPVSVKSIQCKYSMDAIAHSSRPQILNQRTMWTSDPERQLLSFVTFSPSLIFIICTSIFFDPDLFEGMLEAIQWENWGPLNARVFQAPSRCNICVGGNRVLLAFPANDTTNWHVPRKYRLHVMDFSPLAVERRQGLGRVVKEPSTIEITESQTGKSLELAESLTTSLPYVEVVLDQDRTFGHRGFENIWMDKDRIYFHHGSNQLEVIEIAPT
ncbi:hypothetical protein DEU56DRAFT_982325 [Suillus clintonianus]|uniref:uncharacterized protein n=1 Tax=Suillus clintonianus TaxID=1904413 RepID=UPI001B86C9EC|nr:uncharacterized protein DEU56DRAFT_982325 [Suillus clintonianus]KAG2129452.1 hypothetical protein DEU56DRAFT_982325 [Suillus clintonianus]